MVTTATPSSRCSMLIAYAGTFERRNSTISLRRRARSEDGGDTLRLQLVGVLVRDRPAEHDHDVLGAVLAQEVEDPRDERHVRSGEDRDPDGVRVLLDRGLDDLLGRLVEARVDHLHAGVAEGPGDDLRTPVVAVEAGLGDHYTNPLSHRGGSIRRCVSMSLAAPPPGRTPARPIPGYLVEGTGRLLLDCGPGVLAKLREREDGWPQIDSIVISHWHLDHWGDLVPWVWGRMFGLGRRTRTPRALGARPDGVDQLVTFGEQFGTPTMFADAFELRRVRRARAVRDRGRR